MCVQHATSGKLFLAEREIGRLREKLKADQDQLRDVQRMWHAACTEAARLQADAVQAQARLAQTSEQLTQTGEQLKTMQQRLDRVETRLQCVVCYDATRSYLPSCGHLSMCDACAERVKPRACPICKKKYRTARKVFLS